MQSSYKVSFFTLVALIFLIPVFFIPSALWPLAVAKSTVIAIALAVAFIAYLIDVLREGGLSMPSAYILWGVLALPAVYLVSALASSVPKMGLTGYNFETGTFAFILMGALLLWLYATVVGNAHRLLKVYSALFVSLLLVLVYALVRVISHGVLSFGIFTNLTDNPVGAWTDYGVGLGLLAVMSLLGTLMLNMKVLWRVLLYIVSIAAVVLMAALNFSTVWYMTLGAALVIMVYFFTVERAPITRLIPVILLVLASLIFAINPTVSTKGSLGTVISSAFGIATTDVRPSFSSTLAISRQAISQSPLLGSGPNTFDRDWLMYKPAAINATTFWNVAFPFGVGYIPTMLATTGLLGGLVWLAFLAAFLLLGVKALRRVGATTERFALVSSLSASLFLWIGVFLYVASPAVLALAFIFTGLFVASARMADIIPARVMVFRKSPAKNFMAVLLIIVLGLGTLGSLIVTYQKISSVHHFEKALAMSKTEGASADAIEGELDKAIALSPADLYYGALSELSFARARGILENPTTTPEQTQALFQAVFQKAIAAADQATKVNPGNYQNWVRLGNVYEVLVPAPLSVAGAYESAKKAYETASSLSPENPEPYLLMARLDVDHGDMTAARADIQKSIEKKQDYVDAYYFLTQLDVAQNNVSEAIQAAQATAILSPNNAGIFFELGLLKYTANDFKGAAEALQQAIKIVPEYANAKYFLGLSLDKIGEHDAAIAQFQDLAKSNPDNADVASILANLEAGHDAFYKAPANQKNPTKRSSPPIKPTATEE